MHILFVGDIVGKAGRKALKKTLPALVQEFRIDLIIANCENAAGGFGITENIGEEIFSTGVHVLTSGNHIWDKKEIFSYIQKEKRLLRPANYPRELPGSGSILVDVIKAKKKVGVINLQGRAFMPPLRCPFRVAEEEIAMLKDKTDTIIVDFHAEATSEKLAFANFIDGKVSAIIGTHTHVQTADEQILPKGSAYITDVGMTGPIDSIIGMKKDKVLR
ncbi:MAG: TIGR00282 family metallophosphoesterase, partial [Nitrospirae bacterium]